MCGTHFLPPDSRLNKMSFTPALKCKEVDTLFVYYCIRLLFVNSNSSIPSPFTTQLLLSLHCVNKTVKIQALPALTRYKQDKTQYEQTQTKTVVLGNTRQEEKKKMTRLSFIYPPSLSIGYYWLYISLQYCNKVLCPKVLHTTYSSNVGIGIHCHCTTGTYPCIVLLLGYGTRYQAGSNDLLLLPG